jgi:ketosteroid isomerase-like protein
MAGNTPAETHRLWGEAFNSRDVDALVDLYEDGAILLADPQSRSISRGKDEIRQVLEGFVASGANFAIERTEVLEAGDVAVAYSQWTLTGGTGPDGQPMDVRAETTDVLRRQPDGSWFFAIDNPWGVAAWGGA